jgi:hypothetical protein
MLTVLVGDQFHHEPSPQARETRYGALEGAVRQRTLLLAAGRALESRHPWDVWS